MPTLYLIQEQQKILIRTLLTGYLHFSIEEKSFTTQFFFIMIGQFQNESIFIQMWKKKLIIICMFQLIIIICTHT